VIRAVEAVPEWLGRETLNGAPFETGAGAAEIGIGGGIGAGRQLLRMLLAVEVPSAPQAGQATGQAICPLTGSTSNA
jgi:hypothetical protein